MDPVVAGLLFTALVLFAALVAWAALRDVAEHADDVVIYEEPSDLEPTEEELEERRRHGPKFPH
jgi:hypothetical protein